ncbi:Nitrogen permease regulator 3 [Talaromyces islandicus]|uniref:Nitrogen permease regulator 3 n=1 Tax=Talaromyces islandicus TaxID=28573 RepID=A0A0U1LQ92_TALIS|nr:Nitrogen permease regulator 3 [Talaromyces islandicus]
MSSVARPPEPWLVAILLVVQSRAGPRYVFHTPANPDLEKQLGASSRRGRAANDSASDEESESSSDEDEGPSSVLGGAPGPRQSTATNDDNLSTTTSAGGDSQRPPSLNSGRTKRRPANSSEGGDSPDLTASGRGGNGSSANTRVPWDSVFGLPSDVWEKLLSPSRTWHKRRFEIGINDLAFVGWPVFVRDDGQWRKRKRRKKKQQQQKRVSKASEANGKDGSQTLEFENEATRNDDENSAEENPDQNDHELGGDEPDTPEADKDSMTMFNVVFVLSPPLLEYSVHLKEMYEHVTKKFSKALKYEQDQSDYVWKEAQNILQIKERARERDVSAESLHEELVSRSSLAAAIHSVFDKISKSDIAFVSLKSRSADFQIPPTTSIADLPPRSDTSLTGMWLTTANTVTAEHDTGLEAPNQVLAKHFALLLLESEASIVEALKGSELAPALTHYIRSSKPNKSFAQISALSGIPLETIHDLAQHLVYWRRARAIPPLHQRDTYIVSPNCDLSQLKRATQAYAAAFPTLPSLPKMLAALSLAPRPYASFIPSKDHKEAYFSILTWLLRGGWVTQLRCFARVKVTPQIKIAVEEAMRREQVEKYMASSRPSSSSNSDKTETDGENNDDGDDGGSSSSSSSSGSEVSDSLTPVPERRGSDDDYYRLSDSYMDRNSHLNMSSLILFPHRASPVESRWLDEIMSRLPDAAGGAETPSNTPGEGDDSAATDSLKKHWPKFVKYFNGHDALEKIAVREGLRRKAVWQLLHRWGVGGPSGLEVDPREQVLVSVRHW